MKKDRLESFVQSNREEFDLFEPSPGVWDNISKQFGKQGKTVWYKSAALKIAAVAAVGLISSVLILKTTGYLPGPARSAANLDPEIKELIESEAFYAQQVSGKLEEIRKCYKMNPELQLEVEGDLQELESMYNDLKKDLNENMDNKNVIEAMIENNRYRLRLVDEVLAQIKC